MYFEKHINLFINFMDDQINDLRKKSKLINMCNLKTKGIPIELSGFVSFENVVTELTGFLRI